jgi:hypothetical protein
MENTPYLYDTLLRVLGQHRNGMDLRHLKTLAWMMVGLICNGLQSKRAGPAISAVLGPHEVPLSPWSGPP